MTRSRLLARQSVRQLDALAHTTAIADKATRHVEKTWTGIMRVVRTAVAARDKDRQLALPYHARRELADLTHTLHTTLRTDLANRFTDLASWGHTTAASVLGDHLSTRQLGIAVATRRQSIREAAGDPEPALPPEDAEALFQELLFPPLSTRAVSRLLNLPVGGTTWDRQLDGATKLASGDALFSVLVSGFSAGKTHQQIAKDLRPLVAGVDSTARRVSRTFGMAIAHEAQMEAHKQLGDLLDGYQVHAVLDQNTRSWHAHRSGTIYYLHPKPGQKGPRQQPHPPMEAEDPSERPPGTPKMAWSCRCYLAPVLAADDDLPDLPEFRNAANEVIPEPAVYSDWWKTADDYRRKLAVGARRYDVVRRNLGGERVLSTTTADGDKVEFTRHENANDSDVMLFISPHAIAPDLSKGGVPGRKEGVERFLATGAPLQAPRLTLGNDGKPDFIDGRHRTAVLAEKGASRIAISVPREEVERWRQLGATVATGPGRVPEWESFIDPADGSILSMTFLRTETAAARAERIAKVRAMISHRKGLIRDVRAFGFVPEPKAVVVVPAPAPAPAPLSPVPVVVPPMPVAPLPLIPPIERKVTTRKDGSSWVQAKKGGETSPVNGQFYKGGRWMPIHGLSAGKEKPKKEPKPELTPDQIAAMAAAKAARDAENEGGGRGGRKPMTPEEIEAKRLEAEQKKAHYEAVKAIRQTPLGRLLRTDDKGEIQLNKMVGPLTSDWKEFSAKLDEPKLKQLADQLRPEVAAKIVAEYSPGGKMYREGQPPLTPEFIQRIHDDLAGEVARGYHDWAYPRHAKKYPSSSDAYHLVGEYVERATAEELKQLGEKLQLLHGGPPSDVADIADAAKAAGFFPNRFPGRSASGVKVPSGDGFAKKNPASGQYETFTTADVRKLLGL